MSRYVIVGAGAVGVSLAVQLQEAGQQVLLAARGGQLDQLRSGALQLLRPSGPVTVDVPTAADPNEAQLRPDDVLVLATKTQDADAALATWAAAPVTAQGQVQGSAAQLLPVLTLQNGLDAERSALRRFANVLGAVLWTPATYVEDGLVLSPATPAPGIFWLGNYPDAAAGLVAHGIGSDLRAAGYEVQVVEDLSAWKATKLVGSSTFVLDALFAPSAARDHAAARVQAETRQVLTSAGYRIAEQAESTVDYARFAIKPIAGYERPGSSTFQSLARGRTPETDFLNGEVLLLARLHGARAPLAAALAERARSAFAEGTPPGSLDDTELALTLARTVLVTPEQLRAELAAPQPPLLLDVRWRLGDPDGEKHYLDGHIPGAVYVDLDTELASAPAPLAGRHPLPTQDDLQRAARGWGLRQGQAVVVYDDNGGQSAARAWWLLRWAGVADVRLLDGALAAWTGSGGGLADGGLVPTPGDVHLQVGALPVLDIDAATALPQTGTLIDVRAPERYRGESEPIDPRAGHIPGAVNLPTGENLDKDGRFLSVAQLRERFATLLEPSAEASPIGVYCGSGVTASHTVAALAVAGIDAGLFPGSWSAYSNDPHRPAAVGLTTPPLAKEKQ